MPLSGYLRDPRFKPLTSSVPAGKYIFKQGDRGRTMFIVVNGTVQLLDKEGNDEVVVANLVNGQFFGEKALYEEASFFRAYSAKAKTFTTVVEFSKQSLPLIEQIIPDLTVRVFQVAEMRLDKCNALLRILRPFSEAERIKRAIQFFSTFAGKAFSDGKQKGMEIQVLPDDIRRITNVEANRVEEYLNDLIARKQLIKISTGYVVPEGVNGSDAEVKSIHPRD